MSSSTSLSISSLARYRPAVLALTALAAGLAVYYAQKEIWSLNASKSQALRRSNAIHRSNAHRRHRRQAGVNADQPWHDTSEHEENVSPSAQARQVSPLYGTWSLNFEGRETSIPLHPDHLPTLEQLRDTYGIPHDDAADFRDELEVAFMNAFLARELHPGQTLDVFGEIAQLFHNEFEARGLEADNIDYSLSQLNGGALEHHPQRIVAEDDRRQRVESHGPQPPQERDSGMWREYLSQRRRPQVDGTTDSIPLSHALDGQEPVADADSEHSWMKGEDDSNKKEGQSLLNLLYHIAEDQARRDGYVHRGVTCNSCNTIPIRGVRYRCANCIDFDLCEQCEALQIHPKTHLFYKVRIPAPFLGNPRQPQPVSYPGKPSAIPQHLSREVSLRMCKETSFETAEVDALYDQFRCLAASEWIEDPSHIGMAIDRRTFDKCFVPNTSIRPPPPNLIYDRMFSFYDTNGDGLIGFDEFLRGLASLNSKNKDERMKRIFQGYDIDRDGYVDRKDFLRMFRAFYALNKELTRDMIAGLEEDVLEGGGARDVVMSSQPISSAFPGVIPPGEPSRIREGKIRDEYGDFVLSDQFGVIRESEKDEGDHHEVIADMAERTRLDGVGIIPRNQWVSMIAAEEPSGVPQRNRASLSYSSDDPDESDDSPSIRGETEQVGNDNDPSITSHESWPPPWVIVQDLEAALGGYVALVDIKNHAERCKIVEIAEQRIMKEKEQKRRRKVIYERWRRRDFYIDEENGMLAPQGYLDESLKAPTNISLKAILQSPLARPFLASIQEELNERHWVVAGSQEDNESSLAEFFVLLMENGVASEDIVAEIMGKVLLANPPKLSEASGFVNWLYEHMKHTENELRNLPGSSAPSRRSRSSSKVRFQDDVTDGECETRSNTSMSSRSIPVGERWGGYEIPEPEKDVGREVLYQVTQEGLNELLDPLFMQREDLSMDALTTKAERLLYRAQLGRYATEQRKLEAQERIARMLQQDNKPLEEVHHTSATREELLGFDDIFPEARLSAEATVTETSTRATVTEQQDETNEEEYLGAVAELRRAVAAFDTANPSIEEEAILQRPLEDLLQESGYAAADGAPDPSARPSPPSHSSIPIPDPTLPQNRPNNTTTSETPTTTNPHPNSTHQSRLEALLDANPPTPHLRRPPPPPSSPERLLYLMMMDQIEEEDAERGGLGKLSFREFEEIMKGPKGAGLAFVGAWIEMASF